MTTYSPETLLPLVREVYHNAEIFRGRIVKSPVNEYILTVPESHVVDPHSWEFLMSLAIKLKISMNWDYEDCNCYVFNDDPNYDHIGFTCTTESEIKDAVIECGLAVIAGEKDKATSICIQQGYRKEVRELVCD